MGIDSECSRGLGRLAFIALLALGIGTACQTGQAPRGAGLPSGGCTLTTGAAPASLTFALTEPVGFSTAPAARNASERTVYRQLYETLVRIDCAGFVRPGVAATWSSSDAGRVWQFRLRPRTAFWDGAPLTASAIAATWSASPLFTSVTASNESTLRVELQTPRSDAQFFAQPGLAVVRRDSSAPWPVGTGPYRPLEASVNSVRLVSRDGNTLEFKSFVDARRALDAGVDALVTADVAALDYARALPAYTLTAAPWSRTYALVTRGETADTLMPPTDAMIALARDAVRADTRPAMAPFAWRDPQCTVTLSVSPSATLHGRAIGYPRGDATARAIAERLIALAWPASRAPAWLSAALYGGVPASTPPSALALEPAALREAIRKGDLLALVAPLPRACAALTTADSITTMLVGSQFRITPLLDARDYFIHHSTVGPVTIDGDGALRLAERTP